MEDHNDKRQAHERREYFRVEDEVLLDFQLVSPQAVAALKGRLAAPVSDVFGLSSHFSELRQQGRVLFRHLEKESPAAARYAELLEHKLDKLLEVLVVAEMGGGALPRPVDLGADGMGFSDDMPLAVGSVLDLRLGLLSSGQAIRTLAEVLRCTPCVGAGRYRIGVQFDFLRPADQELLVQHVVRRQAALLRARHEQEEE